MTHEHVLRGCRPEPLGAYLQGLGVLRLVGKQADAMATGHWTDVGFILTTQLDDNELVEFFVQDYAPTPMVSPWNKGAGYRGDGKSKRAEELVSSALASTSARLQPWREAIEVARRISAQYPNDKEFTQSKNEIISQSRSLLPDTALDWVDTAIALTEDGPVYPHILGTGGNLGRLDLSANVLGHLDTVLGLREPADAQSSHGWLRDALFATGDVAHVTSAAGQYDPGRAGGLNASTLDDGRSLINPWAFILQLEGALVFASGVARRLGTTTDNVAAMPFTVRPTTSGAGHLSAEERAKGELWLPLWSTPATLSEVRRLFAEARLRWNSAQATSGLDAARAVATLGTDRGIPAFGRIVVAERLGQSPLAVPAGRVRTGSRPEVRLTRQLDPWLHRVRRRLPHVPRSLADGLRRVDESLVALTDAETAASRALQAVLTAVADLDQTIGDNAALAADLDPVPPLDPARWLPTLDDGSAEFALAWAIASLHEDPADSRRSDEERHTWCGSVRDYVRGTIRKGRQARLAWSSGPRLTTDLKHDLAGSLASIHVAHASRPRKPNDEVAGEVTTLRHGAWTSASVAEAFAGGQLDDQRIGHLVRALLLLDVDGRSGHVPSAGRRPPPALVPAWRFLAPLFPAGRPMSLSLKAGSGTGHDAVALTADSAWPSMLTRGAAERVLQAVLARHRVRLGNIRAFSSTDLARGADGRRLAAALMVPVSEQATRTLVEALVLPDNEQHPTT